MASRGSVGIGSVFGIGIEVSWLTLLMLFLFFLISPFFGFLWVLLFICVLVHEMAHSYAAKRNGIKVSRIVLLPFGGVSVIDNIRLDPKVEFNISVVGPLMSLFLGAVFGIMDVFTPAGIVRVIFNELFILNMLLGVFNIIPAFPMDGGRIFRSYLQERMNSYKATMITAKITKAILALIVIGTLYFAVFWTSYSLEYRMYVTLIDLVVAVFIYEGLRAEENTVILRENTRGLKIKDALSKRYLFVKPNTELDEIYASVRKSGEHIVITKINGQYALVNLSGSKNIVVDAADLAVGIPKVGLADSVSDAIGVIGGGGYGIAAVENKGKLVGVITAGQLQTVISLHLMKTRKSQKRI